jgi:hypothetical protein
LKDFGFDGPNLKPEVFLERDRIVRFGEPPLRIEILTSVSGVSFEDCFARRTKAMFDGLRVSLISFDDLKKNKAASGRPKDLDDLQALEQ